MTNWRAWIKYLPWIAVVSLLPLLVYRHDGTIETLLTGSLFNWQKFPDLFLWIKAQAVVFFAALAILWCGFFLVFNGKFRGLIDFSGSNVSLCLVCLFLTLVAISAWNADSLEFALWGFPTRYEGFLVILAYGILFTTALVLQSQDSSLATWIVPGFAWGSLVVGVVGILQFFGFSVWEMPGVRELLGVISDSGDGVHSLYGEGTLSSTLYNPNYIGSYAALAAPLFLSMAFTQRMYLLPLAVSLAILALSESRAGGVGVGLGVCWVTLHRLDGVHRRWPKWGKPLLTGVVGIVASVTLFHAFSQESQRLELRTTSRSLLWRGSHGNAIVAVGSSAGGLSFFDAAARPLVFTSGDDGFSVLNPGLETIRLKTWTLGARSLVELFDPPYHFSFSLSEKGMRILDKQSLMRALSPPRFPLPLPDEAGSGRVGIWARTIPLIENSPWLGYGPGHFAISFSQQDYASKMSVYGFHEIVIDKPHNLYLQIAHMAGVPALAVFLTLIFRILRLSRKAGRSANPIQLGIAGGIVGYLGASVFNDSVVAVAPIFWVFLGTLASLVRRPANLFHA